MCVEMDTQGPLTWYKYIMSIYNNDMNIKLDQAEFIDVDMLDWSLRRIFIWELPGCLKHGLLNDLNAVEKPELLWYAVNKVTKDRNIRSLWLSYSTVFVV